MEYKIEGHTIKIQKEQTSHGLIRPNYAQDIDVLKVLFKWLFEKIKNEYLHRFFVEIQRNRSSNVLSIFQITIKANWCVQNRYDGHSRG